MTSYNIFALYGVLSRAKKKKRLEYKPHCYRENKTFTEDTIT